MISPEQRHKFFKQDILRRVPDPARLRGRGALDVGWYRVPLAAPAGNSEQNEPVPTVEWTQSAIEFEVNILTRCTDRALAPAGRGPQVLGRDGKALAAAPPAGRWTGCGGEAGPGICCAAI